MMRNDFPIIGLVVSETGFLFESTKCDFAHLFLAITINWAAGRAILLLLLPLLRIVTERLSIVTWVCLIGPSNCFRNYDGIPVDASESC